MSSHLPQQGVERAGGLARVAQHSIATGRYPFARQASQLLAGMLRSRRKCDTSARAGDAVPRQTRRASRFAQDLPYQTRTSRQSCMPRDFSVTGETAALYRAHGLENGGRALPRCGRRIQFDPPVNQILLPGEIAMDARQRLEFRPSWPE